MTSAGAAVAIADLFDKTLEFIGFLVTPMEPLGFFADFWGTRFLTKKRKVGSE